MSANCISYRRILDAASTQCHASFPERYLAAICSDIGEASYRAPQPTHAGAKWLPKRGEGAECPGGKLPPWNLLRGVRDERSCETPLNNLKPKELVGGQQPKECPRFGLLPPRNLRPDTLLGLVPFLVSGSSLFP